MTNQELSRKILELVGGKENVTGATNCMTRLRVNLRDYNKADIEGLKATEGVLQVIQMDNLHVVLGPGKAKKVTDQFKEDAGVAGGMSTDSNWQDNKAAMKAGQKQGKVKTALKSVGDIFVPLIPGVIAAGICSGVATLITQAVPNYAEIAWLFIVHQFLTMINTAFMTYITAWAGYRAAEKFGATPILGGMLGMVTTMANINAISPLVGMWVDEAAGENALDAVLRAGRGGVLAVILGVLLMAKVEKWVRSKMPDALDIVVSPLVILAVCVVPYVFVIMPITGLISNLLVNVVGSVCMSESMVVRMVAGFLGSFLFLPLVAVGMHHGLVALYSVQLAELGFVTLYPALAMAGAGQVGAAIAIWLKAKKVGNKRMMSVIGGALPAGVLGVGEPLIYGVTLPMGKPFITAGLGAGFGGAFCMANMVAATTWGPSGVLAFPIMTAGGSNPAMQMAFYGVGLVISYIMGFIITNFTLKAEEVANA
ncbi:MAG: PTS glucose transporter subunit IIB [Ruminococcaceae bacterium]|nr:PTS glucose transporter subunit IIB [Oscillospiraceae bacterium]